MQQVILNHHASVNSPQLIPLLSIFNNCVAVFGIGSIAPSVNSKSPFDCADASEAFGCNSGPFWTFARQLSRLADGDPQTLGHIAWSNLCKIGTVYGNPGDDLVDAQADLAVETLRQEWTELKPTLVVCVAEGYQEQLVYLAFDVQQDHGDRFEIITTTEGKFWRRPAVDGMPAFLWMKHPQGKPREYIDAAESLAHAMLHEQLAG